MGESLIVGRERGARDEIDFRACMFGGLRAMYKRARVVLRCEEACVRGSLCACVRAFEDVRLYARLVLCEGSFRCVRRTRLRGYERVCNYVTCRLYES